VLELLLRTLADAHLLTHVHVPELTKALMERERAGTTALGKGLAMPHLRTETVLRFVGAVGLAPEGVNFQSIDGDPTKLVFLVLGPFEQRERHFELMGRLSALMRDKSTLMFLQGRRTPREVFDYLTDLDARSGETPGNAACDMSRLSLPHARPR
jgi:mannitol/fructose-specific phosphotransferase system IIA component (Ntr-type)